MLCLVAQPCPALCDSLDYNWPGSSVHGNSEKNTRVCCHFLLQGIFWPRDQIHISCVSCLANGFFTRWAIRETPSDIKAYYKASFSWVGKMPWRRAWQPTPTFLPGESPWTEEPGGLQSMVLQRVGHDWATKHT